jgi:hypothetical protein
VLKTNRKRLVGAVGIENNTDWNFKDLEEMLRSAKALKDRECKEILIGPLKAPRFFLAAEIPSWGLSPPALDTKSASGPNFAAWMASRQIKPRQDSGQCFGCGVRRDWKSRFPLLLRSETRLMEALNAVKSACVRSGRIHEVS